MRQSDRESTLWLTLQDGVDIKITAEDTQQELMALKELIDRHELKITCM